MDLIYRQGFVSNSQDPNLALKFPHVDPGITTFDQGGKWKESVL